ncbi:MaoC family dehydratase [Sunxiuqinia elliptica]|uniref:Acyl dehydratase n=1 Tax=Sunxiuqinia elliptica TaxID=655355 RepID=A0A4V3BYI5_9BACT|nr:MaoC family dehydratase [Sunxiuqinia elliptica]TDO02769.1 acyl dehydratase [Sunxiuqinia elliptica]TDO58493.1 acyl dehydratase [Sunxiuqinia elliptica]
MSRLLIQSHQEFEQYLGKKLGSSEYHTVTQEQINQFADATIDHQWIHTDPERAKAEGAFGSTIAHGYLTLSLLPYMWEQVIEVTNYKMLVNYGIDQLKFGAPVLVNSRIRTHVWLEECTNLRGISRVKLKVKMEIEGSKKPAFDGFITFLYHFNN